MVELEEYIYATPVFLVHIEITHAQVKIERVADIPRNVFEEKNHRLVLAWMVTPLCS